MAGTAIKVNQSRQQFQANFTEFWQVTCTLDAASVASKGVGAETIAVPGVALGDIVLGVSLAVDSASVSATGYVNAANSVTLALVNNTAGAVDLASTTVKLLIGRPAF